jgi:ferredoxin-NADP reductase
MAVASYSAQLIINEVISPTTRRLVLERTDQGLINFTPGQFVSLAFPYQDNTYRRSYSIATLTQEPQTNQQLEIVIAQVPGGKATRYFFEQAAIGDQLEVFGPYGVLVLPKADWPKRVVLMATGTGVAPYRTMMTLLSLPGSVLTFVFIPAIAGRYPIILALVIIRVTCRLS